MGKDKNRPKWHNEARTKQKYKKGNRPPKGQFEDIPRPIEELLDGPYKGSLLDSIYKED